MKNAKTYTLLSLILCLFIISCDKKETKTEVEVNDIDQTDNDAVDNTDNNNVPDVNEATISLEQIDLGVLIEGSEKVEGMPPVPNGLVDFQMDTDDHTGYLSTGFLLDFSSEDTPIGAYILFKDDNGNNATSYFDVPLSAVESTAKSQKKNGKVKYTISSKRVVEDEIIVAFNNQVPVGTFCYEICLYDASNNISAPISRCLEIQNWGGSSTYVGEWVYDRDIKDGIDDSYIIEIVCDNENLLEIQDRDYTEHVFVIEEGGEYYETYTDLVDSVGSAETCEILEFTEDFQETQKYLGMWTYNNTTNKFSVVDFSYESFPDTSENEVFDNGEVYIDAVDIAIIDGELVMSVIEEDILYQRIFKSKE